VDPGVNGVSLPDHLFGEAVATMACINTGPLDLTRQRRESGPRGALWERCPVVGVVPEH